MRTLPGFGSQVSILKKSKMWHTHLYFQLRSVKDKIILVVWATIREQQMKKPPYDIIFLPQCVDPKNIYTHVHVRTHMVMYTHVYHTYMKKWLLKLFRMLWVPSEFESWHKDTPRGSARILPQPDSGPASVKGQCCPKVSDPADGFHTRCSPE